jgi:DNA-binding NarL/FixJ family response regulator
VVTAAVHSSHVIVGREAELATLADFLTGEHEAAAGLVVDGEAGIGKTTVVRAALERTASETRRLFARPSAGETELPYAALGDLLGGVDEDALARLPVPQREALEIALGGAAGAVNAATVARGLLGLLRGWCAERPLLVAVDDVQWLDRPTASALSFAFRRLTSEPIRVLLAVRTGEPAESPLALTDWPSIQRLSIGPLELTELGALLRERLGERFSRPRLKTLAKASAGNPMFTLELARADVRGRPEAESLPEAVAERLRGLDDEVRAVASVAAAALRPSVELLLRAGVIREHLRSAVQVGLLELEDERLVFSHPLLAAGAYGLLLPDERRAIHSRLAEVADNLVERGHHVSRSVLGPDEHAAEVLERAAEAAANLGDHAAAARFLLRAAELSPDPRGDAAVRRELRAAAEFESAGDVETASRLDRSLVDRLGRGVARAQARRQLVSASLGPSMSNEDAVRELSAALDDTTGDPAVQALVQVALADCTHSLGRFEESLAHAWKAFELAEQADAAATAVTALAYAGYAECLLGRDTSRSVGLVSARWDESIVSTTGYSPRIVLGRIALFATSFAEAEDLFRQELRVAEERGLEVIEVIARSRLAETQLRAGRWEEALPNARLALEHARQATNPQVVMANAYPFAMTLAVLGRHDEARRLATEALASAEEMRDFRFRVYHRAVLGLTALAEGDPGGSADVLEPAWRLMLEHGIGNLSIFPVGHVLGEALVAVGRIDEAETVATTLHACPAGEKPWCRAMANRVHGLVASAHGDHASARDTMAAALEAHRQLPEPFEQARTQLLAGRVERSARNWRDARTAFTDALQRFDQLGAARWSEIAASEIARLPGRRPADKQALTTREREIAALVVAGLANKDIAARLFISLRTVEANLSRAYAKLGVRSRTELAAHLGGTAAPR